MDFAVDTHFHIWDLDEFNYSWPSADTPELYKNFTVKQYHESLQGTPVKYGIFVQCLNKHPGEAKSVIKKAVGNPFIKGVVAGLNLTDHEVLKKDLDELGKYKEFVGCRHILDVEDPEWIARDDVRRGIEILGQNGKTYDLLLRPHHLKHVPKLVSSLPSQKFVVNHIAKPYIKEGKIEPWKTEIAEIAKYPNVYCKISGLVTQADLKNWKEEDIKPYVRHILDVFGADRCMYGSDWPVCTLAVESYKDVFKLAESLVSHLSEKEKELFFKENAIKFYNLSI